MPLDLHDETRILLNKLFSTENKYCEWELKAFYYLLICEHLEGNYS